MLRFIAVTTLAMGFALAEASVPKGATEVEPGVFKHTDAAGNTFIYRKTPFGIVKSPEQTANTETPAKAEAAPRAAAKPESESTASPFGDVKQSPKTQDVKVVERGDLLEFERPSPFGAYRWKSKKTELTPEERAAWTKARGQQTPGNTPGPKE
jgi:hypothetical protein